MYTAILYFNESNPFSRNADSRTDKFSMSKFTWVSFEEAGEAVLEDIFRQANMDTRPNGRTERSLSVGDVIEIDGAFSFMVRNVGFEAVSRVPFANVVENLRDL